jgi:hypothetical protein
MVDDGRRVRMRLEDFSGKKKEKRCGTRHQRLHFLPPSGKAGRDPHAKGPRRSRQKLRFLFLGHASSINEGKMGNGAMAIHHHPSIHPSIHPSHTLMLSKKHLAGDPMTNGKLKSKMIL